MAKAKTRKRTKQEQAVRPATRNELLQVVAMLEQDLRQKPYPLRNDLEAAEEKLIEFERTCEPLVKLRAEVERLRGRSNAIWTHRTNEIRELRKLIVFEGATPRVLARVSKLLPRP